ncbi:hypothetical protein [Actinocorallia longicatena]|uniref:hypothetical protein n=1 Tax=Actinocorallia longicatena TaxID=111803 RepID=UPI0031D6FAA1
MTLRVPPPLDTAISVVAAETGFAAMAGETCVATVVEGDGGLGAPGFVPWETALECEKAFAGDDGHPFPTCFACGPAHPTGLRLRPGQQPGRPGTTACTWIPAESGDGIVWAALDCPGGWVDTVERVLGRMSCEVYGRPEPGARHILVADSGAPDGRKLAARTALYTADGELLAAAAQTWIAVQR